MPTNKEKRSAIIDRLAAALREQGLGQTGLRGLAALAGTSDRMLIYYFGNKETLLSEVLDAMTAQISTVLDEHLGNAQWDEDTLLQRLTHFGTSAPFKPYVQLWFEIVGLAVRSQEPFASVNRHLNEIWLAWITEKLIPEAQDQALSLYITLQGELLYRLTQGNDHADHRSPRKPGTASD